MFTNAKHMTIGLGHLVLAVLIISTTVLAVDKTQLKNDRKVARGRLDLINNELLKIAEQLPTNEQEQAKSSPIKQLTTTKRVNGSTEKINYRLPDNVVPLNYDLHLHPNMDTGIFSGQIIITLEIRKPTDKIILHAHLLNIHNVWVQPAMFSNLQVKSYSLDKEREFLIIEMSHVLQGGKIGLGIIFSGSMLDKIIGLYSSSYFKDDQIKKTISTSKFEPTYARQAFPCFDEPAFKATYDITLVYPSDGDYHALSNMDILKIKPQGAFTEVYFNRSVPMSSYLACFIISDFAHKQRIVNTRGIGEPFPLRVFATPEQLHKVDFALEVGADVIEYYIDYFQIPYPLPKLDMAAIPDFSSGAMEHWGLVTYRETALLYDEAESSTGNKQRIASVIGHEFAHMWFGNLVTMKWWNDLWLNEGFATYIESKGVDYKFPEWKMRDQFIIDTLHGVLNLDASLASHPIVQTVENPDEITEIFDSITYSKGSSIIRMLEDFLGSENFRQAVTNYLNKFKYGNAVTDDFLSEIDALGLGIDVKTIMRTWTEQMGLPVVEVEQISETAYRLTQKRFLSNPADYNSVHHDSPFNYAWSIPITYKTNLNASVQRSWFYHDQNEIIIELPRTVEWLKFNYDQIGYYRVNYPTEMWDQLATALLNSPHVFSVGDRACLLNDAFSLADSTQLSYDIALDLTKYLSQENEYVPWSVAATKLTSLKRKLMHTDIFPKYASYARTLLAPIYQNVTWTVGDDHLKNRLRAIVLSSACSLEISNCLTESASRFQAWLNNPTKLRPHPDVRQTVYFYGMLVTGNESVWQQVWEIFIKEKDANEKTKLMSGLAAVQVPWILSRFVRLAWDERYVRGQDYFSCLQNIAANPIGEAIVWDYVRENWPNLVKRFGLNDRYLGSLIPSITSRFSTQTKLEEMEYFFQKYPEAGAGSAARKRALETVKNNIIWLQENTEKLGNWLDKQPNFMEK